MDNKIKESVVQQTVLNCIDYYNNELKNRKIDKQYRIHVDLFDKNKSPIIGAVKNKAVTLVMTFYLDIKNKSSKELWRYEYKVTEKLTEKHFKAILDQLFLFFIKECIGLFGLVAEQKIKARSGNG